MNSRHGFHGLFGGLEQRLGADELAGGVFHQRSGVRLPWVAIRSKAGPISPSKGICASICTGMPGEGALHGAEDKRLGAGVQTENTAHQQRGFM